MNKYTRLLVATAVSALAATSIPAQAQDIYYDTNGTTVGFGNFAGTWNGTTSIFNTDATGGASGSFFTTTNSTNNLIFAGNGSTGEVVVSGNQTVGSIDFANTANLVALRVGVAGPTPMSLAVSGNITDSGVGFADLRIINMQLSNAATILTANSISVGVIQFSEESFGNAQFWSTGYNITANTQFNIGRGNGNYTYTQTGGIVTVNDSFRGIAFNAGEPWNVNSSTRQHTYNLNGGDLRVSRIGVNSQLDGSNNGTDIYSSNARLEFNNGTIQNAISNGSLLFQNGLSFNTFNGTGSRDMQYNTSRPLVVALSQNGTHTINADGASSTVIVTPGAHFVNKSGENGTVTKTGAGTLIFTGGNPLAINSYTGNTTVNAGTVSTDYNRIAGQAATGGTDNLSNGYSAASQLVLNGGNYTMVGRGSAAAGNATGVTLPAGSGNGGGALIVNVGSTAGLVIGQSVTNANLPTGSYIRRIIDGTTIELNAMSMNATTAQTGQTLTFGAASFNNTQTINNVSLLQNATVTVTPGAGTSTTLLSFGNLTGSGGLTKAGTGTLQLTGNISYTGATAINAGTLEFASAGNQTLIAPVSGSGTLVKSGAGTLTMDSIPANGRHEFNGAVIVNGGTLANVGNAEGLYRATSFTVNNGAILQAGADGLGYNDGMGSLVVNSGGTFRTDGNHQMNAVTLNGGLIDGQAFTLALRQTVTVGGSSASTIQGTGPLHLEGNAVAGNTTRTFAVADATSSAAADLVISNSLRNAFVSSNVTNLQKTGVGTMLLSGNNTYTGTTTVSAGTLLINGNSTAATGALSVSVGATLGGNGTIGGATTVLGNLQPGNSPGVLTFTNGLTLGSNSTTTMEITGIGAGQFDRVLVTGLLTFGGTLALNSSGYTAVFGNSVDLFNWSTTSGTFSAITGTDLGGGLSWDTSSLYTDGVITVVPEPATWALLAAGLTVTMALRRRRS